MRTLQSFQKKIKLLVCPQKVEKNTLKSCSEKLKSTFFPLLSGLPKRPKQKNSCTKMWLKEQLYIELGRTPLKKKTTQAHLLYYTLELPKNSTFSAPFLAMHMFRCRRRAKWSGGGKPSLVRARQGKYANIYFRKVQCKYKPFNIYCWTLPLFCVEIFFL